MRQLRIAAVLFGLLLFGEVQSAPPENKPAGETGIEAAFARELKKVGQISPEAFARRYAGKASYLEKLSWDPTTAKFWEGFSKRERYYDFSLNDAELAVFKRNGFVVSERLGSHSFAQIFYRAYNRHLPVFITSDAILHAWHRSYDAMLEELEETYLAKSLEQILTGMADQVDAAKKAYGTGPLGPGLADADYFLSVARSLLAGKSVKPALGEEERITRTLQACEGLQMQKFNLFGRGRVVDFSQFKVRGHYENSPLLGQYFKAMMWCGRIDLRVAPGDERELGAAVVLNDLLKRAKKVEQWAEFDRLLQTFVGKTDSMTFAQLDLLLTKGGIKSAADIKVLATLTALQKEILAGRLGLQQIGSDHFISPAGRDQVVLPRSFTVLGQKFLLDSWVLSKVVFDDILWDGAKVQRRIPSGLDVAFAVFGNDQVVPELTTRIKDRSGHKFRDGLPYQHNLAALRNVLDTPAAGAWEDSLYLHWLACLRELSVPTTSDKYPEAMRTRAWAMKSVNTQLASWAELRHDTILYAKQSYTKESECFYPAGFVEPVPHFWDRFEKMATSAAKLIDKVESSPHHAKQAKFFRNFAGHLATLKVIAEKQLARKELTKEEALFLKGTVEEIDPGKEDKDSGGRGRKPQYAGWYFDLFYKSREDGDKWDALVADVHTNVPDANVGDPGCVLHQAVGNVHLLLIAVDNGKDKMVYAGPVLSHYEFEMPGVNRKSDSEWQNELRGGKTPPSPEWARAYLVPGAK
jgi:hypothetical protein